MEVVVLKEATSSSRGRQQLGYFKRAANKIAAIIIKMMRISILRIQHRVWGVVVVVKEINLRNQLFRSSFYKKEKAYFLRLRNKGQKSKILAIRER